MNRRLNCLFEEDIEMQDAIEDIDNLTDDTEDMIITAFEDRTIHKDSLFDDVKRDPEFDKAVETLGKDDEELMDKDDDDFMDDELEDIL